MLEAVQVELVLLGQAPVNRRTIRLAMSFSFISMMASEKRKLGSIFFWSCPTFEGFSRSPLKTPGR